MSAVTRETLPLEDIRTDGGTQSRARMDADTVASYAADMAGTQVFPPVVVFYDGNQYWLADGFHRYQASIKAELSAIDCEVKQGTQRDARLYSAGANQANSLRRTNADKRRAVELLLEDSEWSQWSDRKIGEKCGVHQTTVRTYRASLMENISEPTPTERTYTTRHGTTATMDTSKIGKRRAAPGPVEAQPHGAVHEPPAPDEEPANEVTHAWEFAAIAKSQLKRIRKDDPERRAVLEEMIEWIKGRMS